MKYIVLSAIAALTLIGCGEGSHSYVSNPQPKENTETKTIIHSGGGDVTINNQEVSGHGTYIENENGTITYTQGNSNTVGSTDKHKSDNTNGTTDGEDSRDGTYAEEGGEAWDQDECNSHGYFYCTLADECRDEPLEGSSCTSDEAMNIRIKIY